MKAILTAIVMLCMVTPALADVTIEINGVELNASKSNGKSGDVKIPFKKGKELPDIYVEVTNGKNSILKTPISKDTLSASYKGQKVIVADAHAKDITITVYDKDLGPKKDVSGVIKIGNNKGAVDLSNGGVKSLKLNISGGKPAPAAKPAAPAAKPAAPAAAPEAPAAPAAE